MSQERTRVIIGESESTGISAQVYDYSTGHGATIGTVRWRDTGNGFVLEQFREWWNDKSKQLIQSWCEVSCQPLVKINEQGTTEHEPNPSKVD